VIALVELEKKYAPAALSNFAIDGMDQVELSDKTNN